MRLTYEQIENVLDDTMRECANVKAENAKLRELVRILCYCMHESTYCDGCKLNGSTGRIGVPDDFWACDGLHDRLHELGVEVD